jgi:CRISPR/Cas system-associated endoribonuclease Cas2
MFQDCLTGREYDFPSGHRERDTVPKLSSAYKRTFSSHKRSGMDVRFFRCGRQCSNRWRTSSRLAFSVVLHGLFIDYFPSVVMTDDTPVATVFHTAAPKGHRRTKGETHEKFEIISQSSRENWLHPTVAVRRSDSYFACDISAARLHVIGAKPLKVKKLAHDHVMLYALESKEHRVDTYKVSEV